MNVWEKAYVNFESPRAEVRKFKRRLHRLGIDSIPRGEPVLELFCGRGGGMVALEELGFQDIEGVDLSPNLASLYRGSGRIHIADCRALAQVSGDKKLIIVQGGLHHLHDWKVDLVAVFEQVKKLLRSDGQFWVVEPWLTPFLHLAHFCTSLTPLHHIYPKLGYLHDLIRGEKDTYHPWLQHPDEIESCFRAHFHVLYWKVGWGKLLAICSTGS